MKAEIFYLKGDEDRSRRIERILKQEVFDGIDVRRLAVPGNYGAIGSAPEADEILRVYLDRLRASMIRVEDFRIVISNSLGYWCYMGYSGMRSGDPQVDKFLQISHTGFRSLFPAVAIMDRMVMVPQGIHETMRASSELLWMLRPLDLQGLSLVNFEQPDFIHEETRRIARQVKSEITKLCGRHVQARRLQRPDFRELATLLGVDQAYLAAHQSHITASLINLSTRVLGEPVRVGKPCPVFLEVAEESDNTLKRVRMQIRGPHGVLRNPVAEILHFDDGEARSQQVRLVVTAKTAPYCPLEVRFESDSAPEVYAFSVPVILDVRG